MKQKVQSLLLLVTLAFASCSKIPGGGGCEIKPLPIKDTVTKRPPSDGDCASAICTEYYAEIGLEVVDASGAHVTLDAFHTEDMNGNLLSPNLYYYNDITEHYIVFTDSWLAGHQNTTTQVRFVGFKNGQQVVSELFDVQTDCCHIQKTSGKSKVAIP